MENDSPETLQRLLDKVNYFLARKEDVLENAECLISCCMHSNFELVKVFVKNGFYLRWDKCVTQDYTSKEKTFVLLNRDPILTSASDGKQSGDFINDEVYKLHLLKVIMIHTALWW